MKKIIKRLFISSLVFSASLGVVLAWNGLIAQNGDLLNLTKWNEMITVLQNKITLSDLKSGTNINLTYSGSEVTINSTVGGSAIPYITTTTPVNMGSSQTLNISLNGTNFTPSSTLIIPSFDGTVNSTTVSSPTQLQANITSGPSEILYNLVVSNGGTLNTLWTGNGVGLLNVVAPTLGAGLAGTYAEGFEANTIGSWTNSVGNDADFTVQTGGTPSAGTGPNGPATGTYYIYTEASNPNNPNKVFAVETDNFRQAQSISFDYHMVGTAIGTLTVQTLKTGVWTDIFTLTGQQQAAQADPWLNTGLIDLSSYQVEKIKITYTGGADWSSDAAVDNISIISN